MTAIRARLHSILNHDRSASASRRKRQAAACLAVLLLLALSACSRQPLGEFPELEEGGTYGEQFILHAGGVTPDGIVGSNSLEALDWSYQLGYRFLEMDFCWTEDGDLACVHDWDAYYAPRLGKTSLTMAEFEEMRGSCYGFTSMTLDHLAQWMEEHPDAVIVTDIKEGNLEGAALIAQRYPQLLDQFVLQIYSTAEYDGAVQLGFSRIVLTVYQMTWAEKTDTAALTDFAGSHDLAGLTFPVELTEISDYVKTLYKTGVPLFVHTVNDRQTQEDLFAQGIAGIYTDTGAAAP